jgi:hypothetical protein
VLFLTIFENLINAVQIEKTAKVDARKQTKDGEALGKRKWRQDTKTQ